MSRARHLDGQEEDAISLDPRKENTMVALRRRMESWRLLGRPEKGRAEKGGGAHFMLDFHAAVVAKTDEVNAFNLFLSTKIIFLFLVVFFMSVLLFFCHACEKQQNER